MNILIVDDQPFNCMLLEDMLKELQYHVITASNGKEALEIVKTHAVDVVLLDVMMPVMDGFETAPLIKKLAGNVYLPIIFITALEDHESFERCLAVGGDDFIHKPFDRVILTAKIKAHVRTRKLSEETNKQKQQLEYYYNQSEREYEIVEHIFSNALALDPIFSDCCDFYLSPASMFNGDIFLMAKSPLGGFYCLLGDFTGHGLAAAVGALPVSRIFYTMVNKGLSVSDIAFELNHVLTSLLPEHMFCAAAIIELNDSGKNISTWLGGLPDIYLIDEHGNTVGTFESQHMALGILEDNEFERNLLHIEVNPSHRLVMATDGIIEAQNRQGVMLGEGLFKKILSSKHMINTKEVVEQVVQFTAHQKQQDDFSIALISCLPCDLNTANNFVYSKTPFNFNITLNAQQMKTTDPILEMVDVLCQLEGVNEHRSNIFLILSEAYNNSLDHGVLGLDSNIKNECEDGFFEFYNLRAKTLNKLKDALIIISARYCPDTLKITFIICDSGNGFLESNEQPQVVFREHGRGVDLLNEIAHSVKYNHAGNEVEIVYSLR